jgi:signal transduction histidine kinase
MIIILEIIRAILLGVLFVYLMYKSKNPLLSQQKGWNYILTGFGLLFIGTAIDITDEFPALSFLVIIGPTPIQAFLEKIVGYSFGGLFLFIGSLQFIPTILKTIAMEKELKKANEGLEETVKERTRKILDAQQQLIMQEKMASLGQMTAGIAHEIKNPLNFVTNFSVSTEDLATELMDELGKSKAKLDNSDYNYLERIVKDIKQNAKDISENSKRADSIVQSMMLLTRGEKGERRPVDINYLLDENVKLAYHGFRARDASFNVTIEKNYDENMGIHDVIHQDLGRVFLNIINNACYAARHKQGMNGEDYAPTLSIVTCKMDEYIEIRIRDNGSGIPPEHLDKIFDPFFTTKPTGEGNTGLGLSISYDIIVQGHNGKLEVESDPGEFSEFVIKLPIVK